jgi:hypothetical protein
LSCRGDTGGPAATRLAALLAVAPDFSP